MAEPHCVYRHEDHGQDLAAQLKLTRCPHCHVVGALIRHGFLYGYSHAQPGPPTRRGRRFLCSNRHRRPGCGRTFSICPPDTLRRLSLGTAALWRFLQAAVAGTLAAATAAITDCCRSDRTWHRFRLGQSRLRTALANRCAPPALPACHCPAAHVLAHLQTAFPEAGCPIAAFQLELGCFFA
jgi:hypothetical protein